MRIVARYGVGAHAVELAAAERGITVTNTPTANTEAVADHALALLLADGLHFERLGTLTGREGDAAIAGGER